MNDITPPINKKIIENTRKKDTDDPENKMYLIISKYLNQIFRGFYVFKVREGDVVAASVTFFLIMGIFPMLFLLLSLYTKIIGDPGLALGHILSAIKVSIPELAPWILKSIKTILESYLKNQSSMNVLNIVLLLFVWYEFSKSLVFGINTVSKSKAESTLIKDLISLTAGVVLGLYALMVLFLLSNPYALFGGSHSSTLGEIVAILTKYKVIIAFISLVFFTLFYRFMTPVKIRFSDAILGSVSFLTLFIVGKTFYWVYLHYAKSDLISNFGNFYTLIIAIVWSYYLISSFFLGVSISHAHVELRGISKDQSPSS